ncbi:MAG TPA: SRPBCC family protein [Verrucomicrobiae bacterium]|jgi:hypothetical protein|nr:SRPBCC family protein [Verrucomicrobiae bacterium]
MRSFDFQVLIQCPLEKVFSIYIDIDRWANRSILGEIRWVQGVPWEEQSRLQVETLAPIRSRIDQVVLHFERNHSVAYISHVFGMTCETQVMFTPIAAEQTAVNVRVNIVGAVSRVLGFAIEPEIEKATKRFFEDLRRECEGASGKTSETSIAKPQAP